MKIAVLSGKGGTGKTFVSVNLALAMDNATYVDCDVEEPNGHLYLNPVWTKKEKIYKQLPVVDQDKCIGCKICTEFCQFNALALTHKQLMVFEDICHSCGGCEMVCPVAAITEKSHEVGCIKTGYFLNTKVLTGMLNTKEPSGIPIIKQMIKTVKDEEHVVIDCPPGSACTVMESIQEADYCLLVAEPTRFGSHNLEMVHELASLYNKPLGVVLNKTSKGNNPSRQYCMDHQILILGEIPYDHHLAAQLSEGIIVSLKEEKYHKLFMEILIRIYLTRVEEKFTEVANETIASS